MAAFKLLNLLAVTSLAILACSFGPEPVNALSNGHSAARDGLRGHDALAKRKRSVNGKRCKPRSTPTATSTDAAAAAPTSTWVDTSSSSATWSSSSAAAASSSASSSGSSGSSSSSGSGKGCLAWPNGDQSYLSDYKTDKTNTLYSWSETGPSNAKAVGFDFVPQLWGYKNVDAFAKTVVAGYASTVLGFNEPNEASQSNISPQDAASLWKQYIEPLKSQGYRLGSPATTSAPAGKTWMQDFFTACNGGCNPDFIAVHWYDISADAFKTYVEDWHTTFQKPIWVTEFAYQDFNGNNQGSLSTIQGFMGDVTSWMDQQDYVEKYCWFGAMLDMQNVNPANSLMNSDGSPSALGSQFLYSG